MPEIPLQPVLDDIAAEMPPLLGEGKVADYIPALAAVPAEKFGIAVANVDGPMAAAGDADERFSIQSIAKVFTLELALRAAGPALWNRLGREPSGNPFNSLVQLEYEHGIPRNPFINAGALVVLDAVMANSPSMSEFPPRAGSAAGSRASCRAVSPSASGLPDSMRPILRWPGRKRLSC